MGGRCGLARMTPLLVASEITTQMHVQLGGDVAEWIVLPQRVTLDVILFSNLISLHPATRGNGNNHVEHTSLVPVEIQTSVSLDGSYDNPCVVLLHFCVLVQGALLNQSL